MQVQKGQKQIDGLGCRCCNSGRGYCVSSSWNVERMCVMDLIGRKFGRLKVISNSRRKGYVDCECDCGNKIQVRATSLTKTKQPTRSCGCLRKEIVSRTGSSTITTNGKKIYDANRKYQTNVAIIESKEPPRNNTSGFKGVSWDSARQKWVAYISIHRRRIHIGRFDNIDDAVLARRKAEDDYFQPIIDQRQRDSSDK